MGEEPPNVDAYSRALEQWKKLPGSVVRPSTDVRPPATKSIKSQDARSASRPVTADASAD
jgi:hypothetical protein